MRVSFVPSRLIALFLLLKERPGVLVSQVAAQMEQIPEAGTQVDAEDGPVGRSHHEGRVREVIQEAANLGVVTVTGTGPAQQVRLHGDFEDLPVQELAAILELRIVNHDQAEHYGQATIPAVFDWLLGLRPGSDEAPPGECRLIKLTGVDSSLATETGILRTDADVQQFSYWAEFLGYGWRFASHRRQRSLVQLVAVPTKAVRRCIAHTVAAGGQGSRLEMGAADFVRALGARVPAFSKFDPRVPALNFLPLPFSVALEELRTCGEIDFVEAGDYHGEQVVSLALDGRRQQVRLIKVIPHIAGAARRSGS